MVTTIRNMPDELLIEILGKLPKKDLKKARLACTLWSTAGAKWMFQRIYFAPRKVPMKTFTKIASKPAFAQNVKELVYDGRLFLPELGNSASYWAAFRARTIGEHDIYEDHRKANWRAQVYFADEVYQDSIWNKGTLGAGEDKKEGIAGDHKEFYMNVADSLVRYVRLLDQQERILKNGTDFKALCKGLASFRNISKIGALVDSIITPTISFAQVTNMISTPIRTTGIVPDLSWNSVSPCHLQNGVVGQHRWMEDSKTKRSTSNGTFAGYKPCSELYQRTVEASQSYV